jgi:hypothetical protein
MMAMLRSSGARVVGTVAKMVERLPTCAGKRFEYNPLGKKGLCLCF